MWTLTEINNFYKSTEWKKLIELLKQQRVNKTDGMLCCEHCNKPIVKKYDCIAHHKTELTEDNVNNRDISLNDKNLMLVHFKCHNEIHNRFGFNRKKVYLIYGSPFSGKLDYVKSVAGPDDLIVDLDSIMQAISINSYYNKSNKLKSNAFVVRDILLQEIKLRHGKWNNAFVIGSYASRNERERLTNLINSEQVFINTTQDECQQNCRKKINNYEEYFKYISDWFEEYQES